MLNRQRCWEFELNPRIKGTSVDSVKGHEAMLCKSYTKIIKKIYLVSSKNIFLVQSNLEDDQETVY